MLSEPNPKPSKTMRNPHSDPNPNRTRTRLRSRRRTRNPDIRPKKGGGGGGGAASAGTPQLRWKFSDSGSDPCRVSGKEEAVSARKLAAGVWRSELLETEVGPAAKVWAFLVVGFESHRKFDSWLVFTFRLLMVWKSLHFDCYFLFGLLGLFCGVCCFGGGRLIFKFWFFFF